MINKWKFTNEEGTGAFEYATGISCIKDGHYWDAFQEYAQGGQVDPWKTTEELLEMALADKLQELRAERDSRVDAAVGTGDSRRKDKIISRSVKLLRRELKGTITAEETTELDAMETLDNFLETVDMECDTAKAWLEDTGRTIEQIEGYNVGIDPSWPVLA